MTADPVASAPLAPHLPNRPLLWLGVTWSLVLGSFALPPVRGDGALADLAYWVSFSGKEALVVVIALASGLLAWGRERELPARLRQMALGVVVAALVVGGGALANEYALKRTLAVPRPFVERLAQQGTLGMTPEAFYALGTKQQRRDYLRGVLTPAATPELSERVRDHWLVETGYSFPSGHSYAAASCAALFVVWGWTLGGWRRLTLALLLPWSLAVCYSRPILGVHTPWDVSAGSGLGYALGGTVGWLLLRRQARR